MPTTLTHPLICGKRSMARGKITPKKRVAPPCERATSKRRNIPKSLFAHPTLQGISLSMNQLSGSLEEIPAPLSSPLRSIDLSSNQLSGPIPKSFFQLTSLEALSLDSNKLVGTVELNSLCKLKNLYIIGLSNNMLSVLDGEGDSLFLSACNIRDLRLASCNLKKLPVILRYLDEIFNLDLSSNQLHGIIPSWVWENGHGSLYSFNLLHNMFTSLEKNPFLIPMRTLGILDLSYNSLQGNLPLIDTYRGSGTFVYSNNDFSSILSDFGSYFSTAIYLDLSKNKINGHVPTSICGASKLQFLDLSYNNFTGLVPSCLIEGGNLSMLKLRGNQFHGILPKNIREGCKFETIDLNSNQIEGRLPKSLSNCQFLEVLDVGNNQIVDFFPSWLGNLPKLRVLVLKSNQFNGTVRGLRGNKNRKYFGSLQIIDMASNNFTGIIHSEWFENLDSMMANDNNGQVLGNNNLSRGFYQDMVTITYKGLDLTFTKILTSFKVMDFSDNSFYGVIPQSIGRLVSLHGLNMSHNAFTGKIPSQLGNLMQLESLDLSWNQLSGTIPQELTSLTALAWLNLSCNNLTGKIPQHNQFLSCPNSSFEGNIGLCGSPLSKKCGTSSPATSSMPASSTPTGWSQDRIGVVLLFLFIGLGFGVGFAFAIIFQMVCKVKG